MLGTKLYELIIVIINFILWVVFKDFISAFKHFLMCKMVFPLGVSLQFRWQMQVLTRDIWTENRYLQSRCLGAGTNY